MFPNSNRYCGLIMSIQSIAHFSKSIGSIKKGYRKVKFTEEQKGFLSEYKSYTNYSETKPISWGVKKAIDVAAGVLGSILTAPVMLIAALAVKAESKGPVIFKQKRIGKDGKPFNIYKFRTMYDDKANDGYNVTGKSDARVTKVGKVLRKFSIDEFPQFYNILKGDMSLIGPRPVPMYEHINANGCPEFVGRYAVKPGAKLVYGNKIFTDPQSRIDAEKDYIKNWNLKKDIKAFYYIVRDIVMGKNY